MSIIAANGWQSHFSEAERRILLSENPADIAVRLIRSPDLALRHLQELIANNKPQLALAALNTIFPIENRRHLIDTWGEGIVAEFTYYTEYDMPKDEKEWHAFYIPFILGLAACDIEDITIPEDDQLPKYMQIRNNATRIQEIIRNNGYLD